MNPQAGIVEQKFNQETGRLLVLHRKERGFSQSTLAAEIGVHRNTVARWEDGEAGVPLWHLLKTAYVLRISHLVLLPPRDMVWGLESERASNERDPVDHVEKERDPQLAQKSNG